MLLETLTKQQREPEQGSLLNKVLIKPHSNSTKTTDVASCRLLHVFTGVSQVGVVYLKHQDGSVPRANQRNSVAHECVQIFSVCIYTLVQWSPSWLKVPSVWCHGPMYNLHFLTLYSAFYVVLYLTAWLNGKLLSEQTKASQKIQTAVLLSVGPNNTQWVCGLCQ